MAGVTQRLNSALAAGAAERVVRDQLPRQIAGWIGVSGAVVAVMTLLGWSFDVTILVRVREGLSSMKPITAIALGLAGMSLCSFAGQDRGPLRRVIGPATAWLALVIGVVLAIEWVARTKWGFESVLFPAAVRREGIAVPGRPSYATVASMTLLGVAMLGLRTRGRAGLAVAQSSCIVLLVVCAVALLGYATGVKELYAFRPYSTMALHTALLTLVLAVGLLLSTPDKGLAALLLGSDAGGRVARRLLPICLAVPVLVGSAVVWMQRAGTLQEHLGLGIALIGTAVLCALAIIFVAWALRRSDLARAEAERRIDRMMSELDHRVKNTMAIVISLCDLTAGGARSLPEFQEAYRGRLTAMARAHEALAAARWKGVELRFIVDAVVVGYAPDRRNSLEIEGSNTLLPPHVALPMAVTLHELATNALKHGAWCAGSPGGSVKLSWGWNEARELMLEWTEKSEIIPDAAPREGFGLSLIRSMIPHELRGKVEMSFAPGGLTCRMRAPIANGRVDSARDVA